MTGLPTIHQLGDDLLRVTRWQQVQSVMRPFACIALYGWCAARGWWAPAVASVVALMFFSYTSSSHDYVHRALRLPRWLNEWLLCLTEALALRSGHAFRITHLHHHRVFPDPEDVEAYQAARGFWQALLSGPGMQWRLFRWAWRRATVTERRWMALELAMVGAVLAGCLWHLPQRVEPAIYCGLVIGGSWLYPLATVWWPHRLGSQSPLRNTRAVRGTLVPALFLHHTYHLEHHLYPMVSSHRWSELARRLDPFLEAAGVQPVQVP